MSRPYKVRLVRHNKAGHRVGKYKTVYANSPEEAATMVGKKDDQMVPLRPFGAIDPMVVGFGTSFKEFKKLKV
jgi:hypothetical protein